MTFSAIILSMLIGFIRGVNEGIDMEYGGARTHRWFRWYHWLGIADIVPLLLLGWILFTAPDYWVIAAVILANRTFEVGYGWARYNSAFPRVEKFLGIWNIYDSEIDSLRCVLWVVGTLIAIVAVS